MSVRFFDPAGKPKRNFQHVEINGKVVEMGEDFAEVDVGTCDIHGDNSPRIGGFNQGGHDGMDVCLLCCGEILEAITSR